MKWFKNAIFCTIIIAIISLIICLVNVRNIHNAYQIIGILPCLYVIMMSLLLVSVKNTRSSAFVTLFFYVALTFIRFVITPMLGTFTGYFATLGSHVNEISARKTIFLMSWEIVACTVFVIFIFKVFKDKKENDPDYKQMNLKGSPKLYVAFIILAAVLYVRTGQNTFQFLFIEAGVERTYSFTDNSAVTSAIITYGLNFLILLFLSYFYNKYKINKQKKYMLYSLTIAVFRLALFSSEGRMSIVYLTVAYLWLLPRLFPEHKKFIMRGIGISTLVVVGLVTIYKVLNVFLYDSYAMAISTSDFELEDFSSQLDIYFYGIKTISRNLSFSDLNTASFFNFPFDILRNTFGIHYLFRNSSMVTTSELYNLHIYSGFQDSGNLFSGIAYGFTYFRFILAPVSVFFNIYVTCWVEGWLRKQKYIETIFIGGIIYARLAMQLFSHFSFNWNIVSRTLVIGVIIIECASIIRKRSFSDKKDNLRGNNESLNYIRK